MLQASAFNKRVSTRDKQHEYTRRVTCEGDGRESLVKGSWQRLMWKKKQMVISYIVAHDHWNACRRRETSRHRRRHRQQPEQRTRIGIPPSQARSRYWRPFFYHEFWSG